MPDTPWPRQTDPSLKRALSHPKRREILGYLMGKRDRAGTSERELADAFGLAVSQAAYHLWVLRDVDLIVTLDGLGESEPLYTATATARG